MAERGLRVATSIANGLIDFVSRAEGISLGLVVFLLVLGESLIVTDLVVPGEVGVVVAGAASAANDTPVWIVIVAAMLGAVAGDTAGYLVGRRFGTDVVTRVARDAASSRRWAGLAATSLSTAWRPSPPTPGLAHFAESCRWSPGRLGSLRRASSSRQ
jgi:uncharacterized membrane protein YdjX (TVP38/TMEM64 family)